jgi:DNA-binding transcriptional regulator YdaS (Cro superfamily)
MDVVQLLKTARLDFPKLAALSGLSEGYLRQLSSGNRNAGPQSRSRIAAALREHSGTLAVLAEQLEKPPSP